MTIEKNAKTVYFEKVIYYYYLRTELLSSHLWKTVLSRFQKHTCLARISDQVSIFNLFRLDNKYCNIKVERPQLSLVECINSNAMSYESTNQDRMKIETAFRLSLSSLLSRFRILMRGWESAK